MRAGVKHGILVALCLMVAASAHALEPTPDYTAVQQAFLQEDFETAARLASEFLDNHPRNLETPRVTIWLALSLERLGQPDEALAYIDGLKGVLPADDPLWPELLFWEGEVGRRGQRLTRARLAYQRLLEQFPNSSWALQGHLSLGFVCAQEQAFEDAITQFRKVAELQPSSPAGREAKLFEGFCQLRRREFTEAAAVLEGLLKRSPEPRIKAQASFYLGEAWTGLGRFTEAEQAYQSAMESGPDTPWGRLARFGLGWSRYRNGHFAAAVPALSEYLASAQENDEHAPEALFALAECHRQTGEAAAATADAERLVQDHPDHALAVQGAALLSDLYRDQGRTDSAAQVLEAAASRQPGVGRPAPIDLRRAKLALEQGHLDRARRLLEPLADDEDGPVRQAALSGLGDVAMASGDLDEAAERYRRSLQLPGQPAATSYTRYQLGRIAFQRGDYREAAGIFRQLVQEPAAGETADEARLALGICLIKQGQAAAAHTELQALRDSHPGSPVAVRAGYYLALLASAEGDRRTARQLAEESAALLHVEEGAEALLLLEDLADSPAALRAARQRLAEVYGAGLIPARYRGKVAVRLGDEARGGRRHAEAIRWYDAAALDAPAMEGEMCYRIASLYEEGRDLDLAVQWYQAARQSPWRVRGRLAAARLLERQNRRQDAAAIYRSMAGERIPEAAVIRERLAALQRAETTPAAKRGKGL